MTLNPLSSTPSPSTNALAADARTLNSLKLQAGQNTPAAIKETAKQFEALFMRELLKSMREATMKSGLMDSAQGDLGTDLLDQQFAVQMSGQPGGLADLIAQQLTRQMGASPSSQADTMNTSSSPLSTPSTLSLAERNPAPVTGAQASFIQRHSEAAAQVAQSSGLPASFMIGQAGHESGWGQREIKLSDGSTSFNLFGIKATPSWTGRVAQVVTTEYVNGEPQKSVAKFRAYDSYEDSFRDYAKLIAQSPRYAQARQQTGSVQAYASSLQNAGYATDPDYAAKLSRAINTTLQLQRAQG
jgi:peptidoglycan hydrolase FlgJ